jgi:hypothetical protein
MAYFDLLCNLLVVLEAVFGKPILAERNFGQQFRGPLKDAFTQAP